MNKKLVPDEKSLTCGYCCQDFTEQNMLKGHLRRVHSDHLYVEPDKANKSTKQAAQLKQKGHGEKTDKNTTKTFKCNYCDKTFPHQYILNRHIPVHTDERKYSCDICGKAFRQASTLCRHKVIHFNLQQFKCKVCDKGFNRSSTLLAHEKVHTSTFAHVCPTCGKGFHQVSNA